MLCSIFQAVSFPIIHACYKQPTVWIQVIMESAKIIQTGLLMMGANFWSELVEAKIKSAKL